MTILNWFRTRFAASLALLRQGPVHFPLAWAYALIATGFMLVGVHYRLWDHERVGRIIVSGLCGATFGVLLALAQGISAREDLGHKWNRFTFVMAVVGGPAFGLWIYSWSQSDTWFDQPWIQTWALYVGVCVLVYIARFRTWNKDLALANWGILLGHGLSISALMSILLAGGISATFLTIDALFDVSVKGDLYAYVWTVAGFFFGITYFLGTVVETYDSNVSVPAHSLLPRLVQWVLRPLLTVYFLVIFAYTVKIVVMHELPRGVISAMVWGYGLTGFVAILKTAWLEPQDKSPFWTRLFAFTFPLPLVLLLIAVWRRVSDYGWTESRLFVVLGIFVVALGIWGVAWKGAKALLAVSFAILLLSLGFALGSWGLGGIAKSSQLHRLQVMIQQGKMESSEALDVARHLKRRYGKACLLGLMDSTALKNMENGTTTDRSVYWTAYTDSTIDVSGMSRCQHFNAGSWAAANKKEKILRIEENRYLVGAPQGWALRHDFQTLGDSLLTESKSYSLQGARISLQGQSDSITWRIQLANISVAKRLGKTQVQSVDGLLCWK